MAAFTIAALATELTTDPAAIGYNAAGATTADAIAAIAAEINLARTGGSFSVFMNSLNATDVQAALDPTEFATLTALQLSALSVLLAGGVVNTSSASVRTIAMGIFSPSSSFPNTRANLTAAVKRQGSRAEVLFGTGTTITAAQVAQAL